MKNKRFSSIHWVWGLAVTASLASAQQPQGSSTTNGISNADRVSTPVVAKLEKSPAVDLSGKPIGEIEEIVLSPTGSAQAAILVGADKRLVPIPWSFIRATGDTNLTASAPNRRLVFTVSIDQAKLGKAPGFAPGQWPDMSNPAWLQSSAGFFGLAREEAVGGVGAGTTAITGNSASTSKIGVPETKASAATNGPGVSSTPPVTGAAAQSPNRDAKPTQQP